MAAVRPRRCREQKRGALAEYWPAAGRDNPKAGRAILVQIGDCLRDYGEAIYGTRPWKVFGEGPTDVKESQFTDTARGEYTSSDVRYTTRGDTLTRLSWPLPQMGTSRRPAWPRAEACSMASSLRCDSLGVIPRWSGLWGQKGSAVPCRAACCGWAVALKIEKRVDDG